MPLDNRIHLASVLRMLCHGLSYGIQHHFWIGFYYYVRVIVLTMGTEAMRDDAQGVFTEWGFHFTEWGFIFKLEQRTVNPLRVPTEVAFSNSRIRPNPWGSSTPPTTFLPPSLQPPYPTYTPIGLSRASSSECSRFGLRECAIQTWFHGRTPS